MSNDTLILRDYGTAASIIRFMLAWYINFRVNGQSPIWIALMVVECLAGLLAF